VAEPVASPAPRRRGPRDGKKGLDRARPQDGYIGFMLDFFRRLRAEGRLVVICLHPTEAYHLDILRELCESYVLVHGGRATAAPDRDAASAIRRHRPTSAAPSPAAPGRTSCRRPLRWAREGTLLSQRALAEPEGGLHQPGLGRDLSRAPGRVKPGLRMLTSDERLARGL
jgi:hypothetical protein